MNTDFLVELGQATLAISAAIAAIALLRKPVRLLLGARAAYVLWALAPLAVLAVLLPTPSRHSAAMFASTVTIGLPQALASGWSAPMNASMPTWLFSLWFSGMVASLAVLARRQVNFNRRVQRRAHEPFDEVTGHGPAVAGLLQPRIVLPADFRERYSAEEQVLVLAHEQVHLHRGDVRAQSLASVLRCVFWFNPLVHYAAACFRFDQELACDAVVLQRFPKSRRTYGGAMLKTQLAEFGLPLGCHWPSNHPLKERIAMLKHPLPGTTRRVSGALLVAAVVATGSYAAWAAQPAKTMPEASTAPASPPSVTRITEADTLVPPAYPAAAKAAGQGGMVVLKVLVAVDGSVKQVQVESSKPAGVFDQAAIDAAKQWHFSNDSRDSDGKPVEGWVRVPVQFAPGTSVRDLRPVKLALIPEIPACRTRQVSGPSSRPSRRDCNRCHARFR